MFKDLRKPAKLAWQGSEDSLQIACAAFAKKLLYTTGEPQVFHSIPNGGRRAPREAARLKAAGVLSGVADTFLPLRAGPHCGLYIELKRTGGTPSPEQKVFLTAVSDEGYLALVINDLDTFKEVFTAYIEQRKENNNQSYDQ